MSNRITQGANYSFIGSGWRNVIRTNSGGANGMSFIGSGMSNTVGASWSVINGGFLNSISPSSASGQMSFIGSGGGNLILAKYAVISGGFSNVILAGGVGGAIGGGYSNEISGTRGTVPGGTYNEAAGANSLAAGSYAAAVDDGAFVWSDTSSSKVFESTGKNQFLIRAKGGVGVNTNNPGTNALLVNGAAKITGNLEVTRINGQTNFSGPAGAAATIAVGSTTTGAAGTQAVVSNTGTSSNAVLAFTIPRGATGLQGPQGIPGIQGPAGSPGSPGAPGLNGTNGAAAVISGVTVSNGPAGSPPTVTNLGNSTNANFAFRFPLVLPSGGAGVGTNNTASGLNAVVSGGSGNTASGPNATIPGGATNAATNQAFAAGTRAKATNTGAFVWADASTNADFGSRSNNQFLIRAAGGVGINTNDPGTNALFVNGAANITGNLQVSTINGQVPGGGGSNGVSRIIAGTNIAVTPTNGSGTVTISALMGISNTVSGLWSVVGGGSNNTANEAYVTIGGGEQNTASTPHATIGGGFGNTNNGYPGATIGGGYQNTANGAFAAIGGGQSNAVDGNFPWVTIGGGLQNLASAWTATIGGGYSNSASGDYAAVGGGSLNTASGTSASIGGGFGNKASGTAAFIGGGEGNQALDWYSTVGGGRSNIVASGATVAGGSFNTAEGGASTIGGGDGNITFLDGTYATIGGGQSNEARGRWVTIAGGATNVARGWWSAIPGGVNNTATDFAFAAGRRAKATNTGAFVWADSRDEDFGSTTSNQFLIRAQNGVGINTNDPGTNALSVNGGVQIMTVQVFSDPGGGLFIKPIRTVTSTNGLKQLFYDPITGEVVTTP